MVSELAQKAPGRPSVPTPQRELESENARLRRENEKLQGAGGDDRPLAGSGERHAEGADRNDRAASEEVEIIDLDFGDALEEGEQ
jgi:hypothetical protein